MVVIGTVVLGVDDMPRAVDFWSRALDYRPRDQVHEDFTVLAPAAGTGPGVALQRSSTPVQEHPRVHLDLYADGAAGQEAEVRRLVELGAERVAWPSYPEDPDFVVLADTEGNRFSVIDTRHG